MPNPSSSVAVVPTKASGGVSRPFFRCVGALTSAGSAATAAGGGRRDGEKIGRSRVADNWANGIAHRGLALSARSGVGGGATTRTVVTGGATGIAITAGDPTARLSSERPPSRASSEAADVAAPAPWRDSDSKVTLMIRLRIIWLRAIAPTPSAEVAVCHLRRRTGGGEAGSRVGR